MTQNITESFIDQARKLNEQRLTAIKDVAAAVQTRVDAEQALKDAQAAERKAFRDAEKHGWSRPELNNLRPTKRRRTNTAPDPTDTSDDQPERPQDTGG